MNGRGRHALEPLAASRAKRPQTPVSTLLQDFCVCSEYELAFGSCREHPGALLAARARCDRPAYRQPGASPKVPAMQIEQFCFPIKPPEVESVGPVLSLAWQMPESGSNNWFQAGLACNGSSVDQAAPAFPWLPGRSKQQVLSAVCRTSIIAIVRSIQSSTSGVSLTAQGAAAFYTLAGGIITHPHFPLFRLDGSACSSPAQRRTPSPHGMDSRSINELLASWAGTPCATKRTAISPTDKSR